MPHARHAQRQQGLGERTAAPAATAALARAPAAASASRGAQTLQRQLGNQGAAAFLARASRSHSSPDASPAPPAALSVQRAAALTLSSPTDASEREAVSVASQVMRMPASAGAVQQHAAAGGITLQRDASRAPEGGQPHLDASTAQAVESEMAHGEPLPGSVRALMEPRFGVSFAHVRIHTDARAANLSAGLHAHAFTVGQHVFFAGGAYRPQEPAGLELIAHELTHTVQNGAAGGPASVQRDTNNKSDDSSLLGDVTAFGESVGWEIAGKYAPELVPILRQGPSGALQWLEDRASAAASVMFDSLSAPVRGVTGLGQQLAAQFGPVVASIQTAAAQIARNDCTPLRDAAAKLELLAEQLITPIVERVQPVVTKVKEVFDTIWNTIGAPIWSWIQDYARQRWEEVKWLGDKLQAFANWIWQGTAWVRSIASDLWTWFKNKLGFGDGPEGQDGLFQWAQRKLESAWSVIKAKLEPFRKELTAIAATVGGIVLMLSPAGPIVAVGAAAAGAVQGFRWISANWGKGNLLVQSRVYLEKTLLPPLLGAIGRVQGAVSRMADSLTHALTNVANALTRALGSLSDGALAVAVSALQWIVNGVRGLADWANAELQQLSAWVASAFGKLQTFLHSMLDFFGKVGAVLLDIWGLPLLLGERIWNWVPQCIRDPIVDFLGPIILKQIALFQELVRDNEAWQRTKADVMNIIHLVFKNHDLMGAVKAVFFLVLRIFNLPPELLASIANKAMDAWAVVSKKPLEFLRNTLRVIGHGFKLLASHFLDHLKYGLQGWLLGPLKEKKITPPSSWTDPKAVFYFVLDVLGLSVDHAFDLLKKKGFDPVKVEKARVWYGRITRLIDWVNKSIDTSKSPAENARGMVDQAKQLGFSILTDIAQWVAVKVGEELALMAAAAAASAGLSEVLDVARRIYKALVTAVRWARQIVDMIDHTLDNVLDIAAGSIEKAGTKLEQIMHQGMPVVIGFLADQVGLGDVGQAVRDSIDKLREQVDNALLWLIDKIRAGLEALIDLVKSGVAAVLDWWREKRKFKGADGEPHSVYFEGEEANATLMIASRPTGLELYLKSLIDSPVPDKKLREKDEIYQAAMETLEFYQGTIAPVIDKLKTQPPQSDRDAARERRAQQEQLAADLDQLTRKLEKFVGKLTGKEPELPINAGWDPEGPDYSGVKMLSKRTSDVKSETPQDDPEGWSLLQANQLTSGGGESDWKRMHMITAKVGGYGTKENLIPARTSVNSSTEVRGFEVSVETLVRKTDSETNQKVVKTSVVWIDVRSLSFYPAWPSGSEKQLYGDHVFVSKLQMQAGLNVYDNGNWRKSATPLIQTTVSLEKPDFSGRLPNINTMGPTALEKLFKVSKTFASDYIIPARPPGGFKSFRNLKTQVENVREDVEWRNQQPYEGYLAKIELFAKSDLKAVRFGALDNDSPEK
ncbi:uncharacterized protein DUF4157 [Paraburkholderia sp. BL27I4N3]|uniref:eCIS core domain-containing protein n=1 Tax=Paraburkholderia sp. BL27I4N3 TaxID=1938805 RepID=UPI000E26FC37|nr:DUF4157 domain-containing protein [Paraburkholderia sp. BL27I4N3]REE18411.1 uncharacterized protein DUF4157 [Paraburkholderia sp. BL27I4N3]